VLYEMATGVQAFPGATPAVIFEGILTKQPPAPSQVNGNVPVEFDRIVEKALEKNRETRYQTAADLRADLKRLKRETGTGVIGVIGVTGGIGAAGAGVTGAAGATGLSAEAPSAKVDARRRPGQGSRARCPAARGLSPLHAVARIWLARAHAGAGRHAEARKAYDEAFAIWKDADADLPLLVEARQEYQPLTS